MKLFVPFVLLLLVFTQCRTPKDSHVVSAADYPYIRTFHEGVRLKAKGQYREAITAFDSCFTVRPTDDAAAFGLAQCYLLLNDQPNAAKYTEAASKLDPKNKWYTQELAYMYYNQSKFQESANCFEKLVAAEPRNVDWWYGYAEVLKRTGKYQAAIDAYDKMEDQTGPIPDLAIQKFQLFLLLKQPEKGIQEIEAARKLFPDELALIGTLVDYYFETRQMDKGQAMLEELVKSDPKNGRAYLFLGELYARQGKKKEAYVAYKGAFDGTGVDIDQKVNVLLYFYETQMTIEPEVFELANMLVRDYPNDAKPYSILGDLYLQNKQKTEALDSYKKALKLDDTKYAIWNQVLLMEYENRQFEELYKDARLAAATFPSMVNVQLLYTIACVQVDRYTEAIEAAEIGKELVVNDKVMEGEFYAQQGEAYFLQKNTQKGVELYEKAMKTDPNNLLTKNNYATRLALSNMELQKALELIKSVSVQVPENGAFMATQGLVELKLAHYQEGLSLLKKANELQPNDRNYVEYLGDAHYFTGDQNSAVELWKRALTLGCKNKVLEKKIATRKYIDPIY